MRDRPAVDGAQQDWYYTIWYTHANGDSQIVWMILGTNNTLSDFTLDVQSTITLVPENGVFSNENETGWTIARSLSTNAEGECAILDTLIRSNVFKTEEQAKFL